MTSVRMESDAARIDTHGIEQLIMKAKVERALRDLRARDEFGDLRYPSDEIWEALGADPTLES